MTFRKRFAPEKKVVSAWVNVSALGVYELELNGKKVGEDYFAPGFTSYEHQIQYQTYPITHLLEKDNCVKATVAGEWASVLSFTPNSRYIWQFPFHYGDWCASGENFQHWIEKEKWVGTAFFANSCGLVSRIAELLGEAEDAVYYRDLRKKIVKAYREVFTDGKGKLKKEFQTGYVLPLYFGNSESARFPGAA